MNIENCKEQLYVYDDDMTFDFVDTLPDKDYDDFHKETAHATEDAIYEYFKRMGKYQLYFRLLGQSTPGGTHTFEVIGTMKNLLKWCNKEWEGDEMLLKERAKPLK